MNITAESLNELIKNRRSVFPAQFDTSRTIPDEIIQQILVNACWAPNHGKSEPWYFRVFTGKGLQTLAKLQGDLYREMAGDTFREDKFISLQQKPLLASHVISIGMKRTITKNIPEVEDVEAVACAVQNMYLTASAYGLGAYWTTGGITYFDQAKYHFGLSASDRLLGFFYLACIAVPSASGTRRPVEEKSDWVTE